MQNNLFIQNPTAFVTSSHLASEGSPAKKSVPLGKHTISYSKESKESIKELYKKRRYKTQSIIQKILAGSAGKWRVVGCGKKRISKDLGVGVSYHPVHGSTSFVNVQMCGLKWLCPVCLEREAQAQRAEVERLIVFMQKMGFYAHMMTFTAPHRKYDKLEDLISLMKAARKRYFGDRANLAFFEEEFEYVGHITAMEIKYSDENGWHPHFHTIVFTKNFYSEANLFGTVKRPKLTKNKKGKIECSSNLALAQKMSVMWMNACTSVGLKTPDFVHGLDIKRGYDEKEVYDSKPLINYALKVALSSEIALSHTKTGRFNTESLTPFEIALMAESEGDIEDLDSKYSQLFYEYACATKGKSMVEPSRALKKLLKEKGFYKVESKPELDDDVPEVLDPDAPIPELEPAPITIFEFNEIQWRALCSDHESRGEFLTLIDRDIKKHGVEGRYFPLATGFLNDLVKRSSGGQGGRILPLLMNN